MRREEKKKTAKLRRVQERENERKNETLINRVNPSIFQVYSKSIQKKKNPSRIQNINSMYYSKIKIIIISIHFISNHFVYLFLSGRLCLQFN